MCVGFLHGNLEPVPCGSERLPLGVEENMTGLITRSVTTGRE